MLARKIPVNRITNNRFLTEMFMNIIKNRFEGLLVMCKAKTVCLVSLRFQQGYHLILVFLVVFLYFLSKRVTGDSGQIRLLRAVIEIGVICWTSLLVVMAVRHGFKPDFPIKFFEAYRLCLAKLINVLFLNAVLMLAATFLAYQVFWFRDIEVRANQRADLLLNDEPGEVTRIVRLEKDKPVIIRLKSGLRHLVAQAGEELAAPEPLYVQPVWRRQDPDVITIEFSNKSYEKTKSE